jgi:small-conductance mechanosensitive channel
MNEPVILATAAVLGGLALGALLGALTRRVVAARERDRAVEGLASPAAGFVFWICLAIGIAVAIGVLAPEALDPLPGRILSFLPDLLVAILLIIIGRAAAGAAGSLLSAGLARATGRTRREVAVALRAGIMVVVVLLALGQLGVNTQLLTLAVAAALLSVAAAMALLIGLGGRHVAQEIAAGRYLRRILSEGDHLHAGTVEGTVVALHAATTEVGRDQSGTLHVPNTLLLQGPIEVIRPSGAAD